MTMDSQTYSRWIWSMLELVEHEAAPSSLQPVARDYAIHGWKAYHFGDYALCKVMTGHAHLEAARQDHRVLVLPSVHSREAIPSEVAVALEGHGITPQMTLAEALEVLSEKEPYFLSEQ